MMDLAKKKGLAEQGKSRTSNPNAPKVYSIYEISEAFHKYWEGKDKNAKGSGYKPYMRWENYWQHLVDKDGYLPTPLELWSSWEDKFNKALVPNPTSNWTSIGPFSPGTLAGSLPGTGRVNAIAVDPNDQNIWYAGAPAGGIWKSTNAGDSWTTLFDDFPQIGVSGIAIDPNDSNTIYIATGDDDAGDSFSVGVFKSTNGGTTWAQTGLNPDNTDEATRMNEIVVDPTNSNIIWVGTNGGLQKSIDGGDNWEVKRPGNITDFKLKPDDPNTIYAVSPNQYFRSTNGGDTFTPISDILPNTGGRFVLGVSAANTDVLYILAADTIGNSSVYLGLFKSTDGGLTFTESPNNTDIFESNQAWFDLALEVDPTDENILYTGVLNIWKSTDGGDSFGKLNNWNVNDAAYSHADIHTLKFFNDRLFCGSDGGLYVSDDGGTTFIDETADMAITQFYRISVGKSDGSKIAGGTQDNSGFVQNGGTWNVYTGGDGMDYEVDPNNSNLIYGFTQFGGFLFITTNSGQSVGFVQAPTDSGGNTIQGNWITPLAVASDGNVYSGYNAVHRLNGNTWEQLSSNIGDGGIEDLEVDPNDPMVLYAAEGNTLYRSDDGALTFDNIHSFDSDISDIAINNNDNNVVYITTSNRVGISQIGQPLTRGVFRLTIEPADVVVDDLTFNLPADQAYFAIVHQARNDDNPIYVGTNLGVYRLDDTLTEWEDYFTNLPSTAVGDLEINVDDETITAGTYGRGVWQSPIPVQPPDDDVRLVSLSPISGNILCGEIFPELVVENNGLNPITSIDVVYDINGGAAQNFNWTGTLNSEETTTIQLPSLNLANFGPTTLNVSVSITNDAFSDNNDAISTFIANDFANGGQLFDFESAAGDLVTYNENSEGSVWERGVPAGTLLDTAGSGTQVYGTNLDGNHPDATKGYILSGCYELSNILAPVLKFNMAYDLEINFDIVFVEYSLNDGTTWNLLGQLGSQPNWYNSDRTNASSGEDNDCQNCPGGQWTGTDATLTEYGYDFVANAAAGETDLTGEDNVLFRIVFQSDPLVTQEGAIVDDFRVEGFQDDEDDDNDGILDVDDNCPLVGNANQLDTDGDGEGDACDSDDDNDGILDVDDNCPLIANADQADGDGDDIGDVCDDDLDNDGVPNANDLCADTPAGAVVDVDGCEVFSLPADHFTVLITGESCISNDNGSVTITAAEDGSYSAELFDAGGLVEMIPFTLEHTFENLASGNYQVCAVVDIGGPDLFTRCFDITITEPEGLDVGSKISSLDNEVTLSLSGGKVYYIDLNNELYTTTQSEITLPLSKVENVLTVRTDKDCQGTYSETIVLSSQIFVYPNPVSSGELNIYLGSDEFNEVETSIFNLNGARVFTKSFAPNNGYVNMDISGLSEGIYLLNIKTGRSLLNYKIVRK